MPNGLLLLLVLAAVIALIGFIARQRAGTGGTGKPDAYLDRFAPAAALLTANETEFFRVAQAVLEPRYRLFAKVLLRDLVEVVGRGSKLGPLGKVGAKHIDFAICDTVTFRVVGTIEVDDATHQRADRADSDKTKDAVLAKVGIPLIRIRARASYGRQDVETALKQFLVPAEVDRAAQPILTAPTSVAAALSPGSSSSSGSPVACPRCGLAVVERTSKAGKRFQGCSGFPACRYTADGLA
ncbi:MAG: DUF2726 domain-containing protein [Planctomycetes bacterium]|nr:DUF2726 domain-containing protein [Planctomycetota bacterium]